MSRQPNNEWRNWGDHPFVVIVSLIVAFLSIFAFFTGKDKIQDLFSRSEVLPTSELTSQTTVQPTSEIGSPDYELIRHMTLGLQYYDDKKYDLSIIEYTQAINIKPDYAIAYNRRGNTYAAIERDDLAILDYLQAEKFDPKNPIYHYNKGRSYQSLKKYDDSIASYKTSISLDPDMSETYRAIASAYVQIGDNDNAISNLRKCSETTSDEILRKICDQQEYKLLTVRLNK